MNIDPTNLRIDTQTSSASPDHIKSAKTMAIIIYALQALSVFTLVTGIVAVVLGHIKLADARGTWLESHIRWQIRTFWYGVLWCLVTLGFAFLLLVNLIPGFSILWYLSLFGLLIWMVYRIAKGSLRLSENRPV